MVPAQVLQRQTIKKVNWGTLLPLMICQGVYAVGCRIQQSRCTKPTAIAEAVYATADDVTRTVTTAANKQLSNGSGSSSSELQDHVQLPRCTLCC
jgi:hypothetical protein